MMAIPLLSTAASPCRSGPERKVDLEVRCNLEDLSILAFVVPLTLVAARPRGYWGDAEVDGCSLAAKSLWAI